MLIEIVTPLMLATAPIVIDVPKGKYDHQSQVMTYEAKFKTALTMSGTQTFGGNGRPIDNDND